MNTAIPIPTNLLFNVLARGQRVESYREAYSKWAGLKAILPDVVILVCWSSDRLITFGEDCAAVWGTGVIYSCRLSGLRRDERSVIPDGLMDKLAERLAGHEWVVI